MGGRPGRGRRSGAETLATRVTEGRRRAALARDGRGHCCNWSPSSLQALGSKLPCRRGQGWPAPSPEQPPGNDCVQAELQGLCIQPRHHGVLLPSQQSPFPCSFPQACWRGAFEAQIYQVGGVPWACSGGQWLVEGG